MTTTPPGITDSDRRTLLRLLSHGRSLAAAAIAIGVTEDQAQAIADQNGGVGDPDALAEAAEHIGRTIQQQEDRAMTDTASTSPTTRPRNGHHIRRPGPPPGARPTPAPPAPAVSSSSGQPAHVEQLLDRGRQSAKKRTAGLAEKIAGLLEDLEQRLDAEEQAEAERKRREAEREEALAEVREAEQQLRHAREKARAAGGSSPPARRSHNSPEAAAKNGRALDAARAHQNDILDRHGIRLGDVRAWANSQGIDCPQKGSRIPRDVLDAYDAAQGSA